MPLAAPRSGCQRTDGRRSTYPDTLGGFARSESDAGVWHVLDPHASRFRPRSAPLQPETRYARAGDLRIAYQVVGDGPMDLMLVDQWFSNVVAQWRLPPLARFIERLATFSRVILLDKRGTGVSDPVPLGGFPTLEEWMDDIHTVLEAVGSERTALLSGAGASLLTILFAATHPDRTSALILVDGYPRISAAPGYVPGLPRIWRPKKRSGYALAGGKESCSISWLRRRRAILRCGGATRSTRVCQGVPGWPWPSRCSIKATSDTSCASVRVPTLILNHARSARVPPAIGAFLADQVPGARHVEIPGTANLIWAGDQEAVLAEVQEFLTGMRPHVEPDRVLATVLFTDIIDSTSRAAELGDTRWRHLLEAHREIIRAELDRFRGREIDTTGDGFLATFDGPARAIRCAVAICSAVRPLGLEVRAGLHTGESSSLARRSAGSQYTSAPEWPPWPAPARSSSPARSRIWWQGRGSSSRTVARTSSRAFRASGAYWPSSAVSWPIPDEGCAGRPQMRRPPGAVRDTVDRDVLRVVPAARPGGEPRQHLADPPGMLAEPRVIASPDASGALPARWAGPPGSELGG